MKFLRHHKWIPYLRMLLSVPCNKEKMMHCYQWNPLLLLSNANDLICNQYDFNIGECLAPTNPKTNLILDTLNDSSCMELYRKQEVVPLEQLFHYT